MIQSLAGLEKVIWPEHFFHVRRTPVFVLQDQRPIGRALFRWTQKPFNNLRREPEQMSSTKRGTTTKQKNEELHDSPFGMVTRVGIPFTDHKTEIRHFPVLILRLMWTGISSRDSAQTDSFG
jgi:hypothetical protein